MKYTSYYGVGGGDTVRYGTVCTDRTVCIACTVQYIQYVHAVCAVCTVCRDLTVSIVFTVCNTEYTVYGNHIHNYGQFSWPNKQSLLNNMCRVSKKCLHQACPAPNSVWGTCIKRPPPGLSAVPPGCTAPAHGAGHGPRPGPGRCQEGIIYSKDPTKKGSIARAT